MIDTKSRLIAKVVSKIDEIPQNTWESIFPKVLENYHFFKSLDETSFDQFSFFYIIVYDNDIPIGCTSCFLMNFPLDIAVNGPLKIFFNSIKKIVPNIFNFRVLMCGLPMGPGRIGIIRDFNRVIETICDCLEKIAKDRKASMIIFKDFTRAYEDILKPLLSKGFSKLESFPSTDMDIRFKSFDEYLKTLSPASRENLKRNFKKVDGKIKIDLEVRTTLENSVLPQVYELYLQTYDKQNMKFEKLPMDFFRNVSRNMPKEVKYFLWRIEGKLVAFAFCLISGDYFIDYYLGFDYSVAHRYHLYFIRFRDLMNWCIEHGIKKYEMGVTSYESKRRLGFNFVRFYFYMKHRNKLLNPFFGLISCFMKPTHFDNVFEQMNKA